MPVGLHRPPPHGRAALAATWPARLPALRCPARRYRRSSRRPPRRTARPADRRRLARAAQSCRTSGCL